ncbi:triosephosphate isomerase, partial [Bacteroidetes/Chlorobi group bacterium ChocPot_Mid]
MLIAGNWKMNTVGQEALILAKGIIEKVKELDDEKLNENFGILICPPFINIPMVSETVKGTKIKLGAQNCSDKLQGAFTGEVSVPMIKHFGGSHIIIGHSERRQYYHENDYSINQKLKIILESGLNAIVCIGETLDERQSGKTYEVLSSQLKEGLKEIQPNFSKNIVIAY